MRAEKLPDLKTLLSDARRPARPQTDEEIEIAADGLFLAMGGDPEQLARARATREAKKCPKTPEI